MTTLRRWTRGLLLALLPVGAAAQAPPAQVLPGGAAFERREIERRQAVPEVQPRPAPPTPAVPATPGAEPRFRLNRIVLDGAVTLPPAALEAEWLDMLGREVTVSELEALAARLSARYRAAGFVLSQVVLPSQTVTDGVVRLVAVEGFIDRLEARGGWSGAQAAARDLLAPAAAERPLRLQTLERGLLLSRDLLGAGVEGVLRPSDRTFGAADLGVELTPRRLEGFVALDNRASYLFGPWTARAGATLRGPLGGAERLDALIAAAPDSGALYFGQVIATIPVFAAAAPFDGSTVQFSLDRTDGKPILDRIGVDLVRSTQAETNARAAVILPLIRSRPENLYARFGVTWRESTASTRFDDIDLGDATDRLVILDARLTWDFVDRFNGVTLLDGAIRQGVAAAGVTRIALPPSVGGQQDFTLAAFAASRVQAFGDSPWSLAVEGVAQIAADTLPNSERFALGGERLGRGFGPGNTTGDSGYGGRLELRHNARLPVREPWLGTVQSYVFADWGAAIDRANLRDGRTFESLASVGFGARIDLTERVSLLPELATQVVGDPTDTASRQQQTRFLIGLVARW